MRRFIKGEPIEIEDGFARLVNAMVDRAVHDYSHRRSTFLADGGQVIRTARSFIFMNSDCALSSLVDRYRLPLDVIKVRERAINEHDRVELLHRERLLQIKREWWRVTGRMWRDVRASGRF